jgi:hypothetical protein
MSIDSSLAMIWVGIALATAYALYQVWLFAQKYEYGDYVRGVVAYRRCPFPRSSSEGFLCLYGCVRVDRN